MRKIPQESISEFLWSSAQIMQAATPTEREILRAYFMAIATFIGGGPLVHVPDRLVPRWGKRGSQQ